MNSSIFFHKGFRRVALASVVALGAFGTSNSFAAESTGNAANANVLTPITITPAGTTLSFGGFTTDGAASTVTIAPDTGARTSGAGIVTLATDPGNIETFTIEGTADANYGVTINAGSPVTLTNTIGTGSETMTFAPSYNTSGGVDTGGTLAGGSDTLSVGGVLTVNASQVDGLYTGVYPVTVDYQ